MNTLHIKNFDLAATVRSGHLFHYDELQRGEFRIMNGAKSFVVRQEGNILRFAGTDERSLRAFFDLNQDVNALHHRLRQDKVLRPLLTHYKGIRLVRQDTRQALVAFILSSNNNQQRIKGMVDRHRTSPLHSAAEYTRIGFGYRAAWLATTEQQLTPRFLAKLRTLDYDDAKALLQTLPGVGPKVADCVLAYSELARGAAFPADVWVKKALQEWYSSSFTNTPLTDKNIRAFAKKKFGNDAAYAQHYLFLAAQEKL